VHSAAKAVSRAAGDELTPLVGHLAQCTAVQTLNLQKRERGRVTPWYSFSVFAALSATADIAR